MRGAAARWRSWVCGSRARRRGARPSTRRGRSRRRSATACSTCRLVIAGVLLFNLAVVDDAQTISLSKGPSGPVPTELLMIHLRRSCFSSVARRFRGALLSFPRSQVRSSPRRRGVCKCMICISSRRGPPAATPRQSCGAAWYFARGFFMGEKPRSRGSWNEPTSPAASSLEFLPLLFWLPAPALALILNKKTRGHAPCETSSAGMRGGVCANNN